jgi:Raf kinase inhibitor-like YbhB/YbcL family protein
MKLTSSQFAHGAEIPATFTVEGQDISPPLAWSDVPAQTRSFALICDDPDAPSPRRPAPEPWVHWVLFNIPADSTALAQAISQTAEPAEVQGARQGKNSWPDDNIGYRGPAPPPGSGRHRYFFKLYALDTTLELPAGATKQQLLAAMSGHLLGEGQLMGTYER